MGSDFECWKEESVEILDNWHRILQKCVWVVGEGDKGNDEGNFYKSLV